MTQQPWPDMQWLDEERSKRLNLPADVTYRSVLRLDTGETFAAPLGAPDPWPADSGVPWVETTPTT